jgi:hypothetical protein
MSPGKLRLVDDTSQDEQLILRAPAKANLADDLDLARAGRQALD